MKSKRRLPVPRNAAAALSYYNAACRALAKAGSVDQAKHIRDAAMAAAVYAKQAKNRDLEADAVEIRLRATRKLDEIRQAQKASVGLNRGTLRRGVSNTPRDIRPTLESQGVDKNLAKDARRLGALAPDQFERTVTRARDAVRRAVRHAVNDEDKRERRAQRERALGDKIIALPQKKYGLILADPEWKFVPYFESGLDRSSPANHYRTSPLEAIKARDVPSIAHDDCILFLWATVPMLPQCLDVMAAWGFAYKSHLCWVKTSRTGKPRGGTGYWFRGEHELLLIGTRGGIPAPVPGDNWPGVLFAKRRGHSVKPDKALEMIESYFPTLPKIELNRRGPARPGWDAWGDEAESEPQIDAAAE